MNSAQLTRIDNSKTGITVFEFRNETDFVFKVTSDSGGLYDVVLNKKSLTLNCSCNDMKYRCKSNNMVCKHVCYVLLKLLPFNFRKKDSTLWCYNPGIRNKSEYFKTFKLTNDEFSLVLKTLKWRYPNNFKFTCSFSVPYWREILASVVLFMTGFVARSVTK